MYMCYIMPNMSFLHFRTSKGGHERGTDRGRKGGTNRETEGGREGRRDKGGTKECLIICVLTIQGIPTLVSFLFKVFATIELVGWYRYPSYPRNINLWLEDSFNSRCPADEQHCIPTQKYRIFAIRRHP